LFLKLKSNNTKLLKKNKGIGFGYEKRSKSIRLDALVP